MPAATFASRLRAATRRERTQNAALASRARRADVEAETTARIEALIEQLSLPGNRITVDTAVFRDAVVVVVRANRGDPLDARQSALLREHATTWSSIGGKDGRTVCFEVARCT